MTITNKELQNKTNEELCTLYQHGNQEALTVLIENNGGLVRLIALRCVKIYHHTLDLDDLIQICYIGLFESAKTFEASQNTKFSTYATQKMKWLIQRAIAEQGYIHRIPDNQMYVMWRVIRAIKKYEIENLSKDEQRTLLKAELNLTDSQLDLYFDLIDNHVAYASLYTQIEDDTMLEELISSDVSVENEICNQTLKEDIDHILNKLSEKERNVLRMRYWQEMTLEAIGKQLNVTRERVRQIEIRAIQRLKQYATTMQLEAYLT